MLGKNRDLRLTFNKIIFYLRVQINAIFTICSLISIFIVSLNILSIIDFGLITFLSSGFILLFLPFYPLFFLIYNSKNFNIMEKLTLTIILNISFYILLGFTGYYLNIPLTSFYFIILTGCFYLTLLIIFKILLIKNSKLRDNKLKLQNEISEAKIRDFLLYSYLKKRISRNGFLLVIFIILMIVLDAVRVDYFIGTDPWLHISIIKYISIFNELPLNAYQGAMGLHVYGTVFHFFSGIDIIFIPRLSIWFTFPLSSLILYNIFIRVFRNKNLAILGIFILLFSSLGFLAMIYQYWPSGLTYIQGLFIFYLLYRRLENFVQSTKPNKKLIKEDLWFNYIIISMIFVSSILTHSLVALVMLITFLWIFIIYFAKDIRRGFDFLLLCFISGIFILFYAFDISTGHLAVFNVLFELPWYLLLGISFGALFVIIILVRFYKKSLIFTDNSYKRLINNKICTIFENKIFIPLCIGIALIISLFYITANFLLFNLDPTTMLVAFETTLYLCVAVWGIFVFRHKPRGRILWLWTLILLFLSLGGLFFDVFSSEIPLVSRLLYMSSLALGIGFISHIYKLIKIGHIGKIKNRLFLSFLIIISLFSSLFNVALGIDFMSLDNQDVTGVQWYGQYSSKGSVIITEFGWNWAFIYYGYPFESSQGSDSLNDIYEFVFINDMLTHPTNHYNQNGTNILQKLKRDNNNSSVVLILADHYLLFTKKFTFYDALTAEEMESYYNLPYLNRIFSVKSEDGEDKPYYWVI